MGCGCNKGKAQVISTANTPAGITSSETTTARMTMSVTDSDYDMVEYVHPNRGEHPVVGFATGKQYGFRSGGGQEKFLVHKSDIAAMSGFFRSVSEVPSSPKAEIVAPPPPTPIAEPDDTPVKDAPSTPPKDVAKKALNQAKFDLQRLPGVTPNIAKSLIRAGLISPEIIISGGLKSLEEVKYVGQVKAKLIFEYVTENYGTEETR